MSMKNYKSAFTPIDTTKGMCWKEVKEFVRGYGIDPVKHTPEEVYKIARDLQDMNSAKVNSLDCCTASIPSACTGPLGYQDVPPKAPKEKNMRMYNEDMEFVGEAVMTENERKASYFQGELNNASFTKRTALVEQFKLDLQNAPHNPKELVEWIKDGKFSFKKNQLNDDGTWREPDAYHRGYDLIGYLTWNNPDRDVTGCQTAVAKLDLAEKTAERAITAASTPAEMLKVLQDFESTTLN